MYSYTYELLRTLTRTEKRESGSGVGGKVVISAPIGRGVGQVAVGGGGGWLSRVRCGLVGCGEA